MKKITVMVAALMLAGCASVPKPQAKHSYTAPAKIVQPAPVEQAAPKQKFKERWLTRFFRNRAQ